MGGLICGSMVGHFWTFLLKPPQPLIGLFLVISLSPRGPCGPCIILLVPVSSPHHPHHPHIVPIAPRRSPCGPQGCGFRGLHPCCPHCPCHLHIVPVIPTSSRRSPDHSKSPRYPPHPPPPPGGGRPQITKNAVRFELIEIF